MFRKKRIKLAGQKIEIVPFPAREGLEAVIELSRIIHDVAPYLSVLADSSRKVRVFALMKMFKEVDGLPDVILDLVSKATGIDKIDLESKATTQEVLVALTRIIKVNDWDKLWKAALNLELVDSYRFVDWMMLQVRRIWTRA